MLRCRAAEEKHEELTIKLPEATQPLLKQMEELKGELEMRTDSWAWEEKQLVEQIEELENKISIEQEKTELSNKKINVM